MNVLLIEDNELNRDMLKRRLERKEFIVSCAEDGQSGIDMAKNEQTQVISFTVDHAFVELPSAISEEKPTSQNTILMMVIAIAVAAGVIIFIIKKARKTSTIKS